ncbi:holo-ACP synthase [Aeromicrobium phragmitis]|uniref:Holo-[acyl-carrier-protein] synthase n=1 Tax=Aeromicrobium phragmitis TaxID=2478914 RepID=A0A3L8PIG5_9ACTN|nr:holo-ACP synthase [Aeromicrobium phragmitis]RLV55145.1 holo-ACP synthase [Aeromicrobium phragmitis]
MGVVVGTGVDLVHVPGFAEQLQRPGAWIDRVFTPGERRDARRSGRHAAEVASFAARWAAKEAFVKAWSESLWGSAPLLGEEIHHLIEVVTDAWGRPRLVLHGEVAEALGDDVEVFVSLTHDGDYALAQVTLSRAVS